MFNFKGGNTLEKKKILLPDDEELLLALEKTFFRRDKFELLVARTGEEVLEMAELHRPDLVLLDISMPGTRGTECCRRIKEDPRLCSTPVILVAPGGGPEEKEQCQAAGCDDVLLNPIDRQYLLSIAQKFFSVSERAAPRIVARLRISYGAGTQHLLSNYSVNLSTGGVFLECDEPLPEDTPLALEILLPTRDEGIRCRGRVAWVNSPEKKKKDTLPPGMGLQFLDLSLDDLHAIREFIDREYLTPSW
jgi:uncharacterized protein (TIGR02266 family)